jgi:hypothetical protein
MATNTGTLTLKDLLSERFQSVAQFGVNTVLEVIQRDQAAYNRQLQGMFDLLADTTADRQRISGASGAGEMIDVDEAGTGPTQKAGAGASLGFPMRAKQWNLGWTRRWFQRHSPAEMAEQTLNGQQAHMRGLIRDMKRAIYTATNATFRDKLATPQVDLLVKAFAERGRLPDPTRAEWRDVHRCLAPALHRSCSHWPRRTSPPKSTTSWSTGSAPGPSSPSTSRT